MGPDLIPGLRFAYDYRVPPEKTVRHLFPEWREFAEMPDVLATGFMVGLIEGVCQMAIKPQLDWPREQSLGTLVSFSHLAATAPGMTVRVEVEATEVEGRRVRFAARAHDGHDLISEGSHERFVIDVTRFADKLARKKATAGLP